LSKRKASRTAFAYVTIGLQLAITVLIFLFGGYKLDTHFDKSPIFVTLGAFIGMGLGFYFLIKELKELSKQEKDERDSGGNEKRAKWM
jgi:F0F1-type ATP synthase assembly protein I